MWTQFFDMHSGGGRKLQWEKIYIEASEEEAKYIFEKRFRRDPCNVTCDCCGQDYSIHSGSDQTHSTLEQLTGYDRNCAYEEGVYIEKQSEEFKHLISASTDWDKYLEANPRKQHRYLAEHLDDPLIHVIYGSQILESERVRDSGSDKPGKWVWIED